MSTTTTETTSAEPLARGPFAPLHRPLAEAGRSAVTLSPSDRPQLASLVLVAAAAGLWFLLRAAALPLWIAATAGLGTLALAALLFVVQLVGERSGRYAVFDLEGEEVRFSRSGQVVARYPLGDVIGLQLCPPGPTRDGRAFTELNLVLGTPHGLTRVNLARTLTHRSARRLGRELAVALGLELGD